MVFTRASRIALIAAGGATLALALTPAISAVVAHGATPSGSDLLDQAKVSLKMLGSIGSFTPVTRDQRLARAYADAARESQTRGFKFTPSSGSMSGERTLTVVVRAGGIEAPVLNRGAQPNVGLAPVAYNLGRGRGLDRFTTAGREPVRELEPITSSVQMPSSGFALQPGKRNRFSTNLQVEERDTAADAPTNETPQTLGTEKSYAVDLNGSFSLSRNLDVQAGIRYRGPDNRLVPLTDQQKDSQAVYVGTKFKF